MLTLNNEYFRIRSGMSSSAGGDFPLKPLPEEAACLDLVNEAEKWLAKVKKAVQVRYLLFSCIF